MRHLISVSYPTRFLFKCLLPICLWAAPCFAAGVPTGQATPTAVATMTAAEMAKKATEQSAEKHRIETLSDGRARVPAPLQAIVATVAPDGVTVVSTTKEEPGTFVIRAAALGSY